MPINPSEIPIDIANVHGTLVYAAREGGRTHIWGYRPGDPSPLPITSGEFDDRDPVVSPDGDRIAFVSSRAGPWELYILDVTSGNIQRLTETPGYVGSPTWSPDGRWLAFEMYHNDNFDIWVMPLDADQEIFQLTNDPGMDIDPTWDPNGRRIAFVSDRSGLSDIYLADLDHPDERFSNVTHTPEEIEVDPQFSHDGQQLLFTRSSNTPEQLWVYAVEGEEWVPEVIGSAREAAWAPDGSAITGLAYNVDGSYVITYALSQLGQRLFALPVHDQVQSLDWTAQDLPLENLASQLGTSPTETLFEPLLDESHSSSGRRQLRELPGVSAPNPFLSDATDEAFNALRERTGEELGWDFLADLENAFVGLNDPLPPGIPYNDWLYTGRAFAFNQDAVQAGWIELLREDINSRTYWRVYIRTAVQDGSLGEPLREAPWDFQARYDQSSGAYDSGGRPKDRIPAGYYLDFTELAADYGFSRVPAVPNWRSFYEGARFNEFVYREDLDWLEAMLELYPPSAIVTPTPFQTPTPTPSRTPRPTPTPWWWRWRTPTPIPSSP